MFSAKAFQMTNRPSTSSFNIYSIIIIVNNIFVLSNNCNNNKNQISNISNKISKNKIANKFTKPLRTLFCWLFLQHLVNFQNFDQKQLQHSNCGHQFNTKILSIQNNCLNLCCCCLPSQQAAVSNNNNNSRSYIQLSDS